jgi:hypothetical protein
MKFMLVISIFTIAKDKSTGVLKFRLATEQAIAFSHARSLAIPPKNYLEAKRTVAWLKPAKLTGQLLSSCRISSQKEGVLSRKGS